MSFFIGNCCLKLHYLICGSNESSSDKKKLKFKSRPQNLANNKVINRTEPTPISSYHHHYVNVTPLHHTIQQQNSIQKSLHYENIHPKQYSHKSSSISFINPHQSSSLLTNGIIIKDIILARNDPKERLGLTLCYGITSKSSTNIYIQQIDQGSIASQQGELRNGDQIIKINNHRVTSRDEAINLINGSYRILLQIIRFELPKNNFSPTPLTEDDSGVILACHTDGERIACHHLYKSCFSLSLNALNHCSNCHRMQSYTQQFQYRRCLSLNDLRPCSFSSEEEKISQTKQIIRSQSLFGTTTDNEQLILKPLPLHPHREDSDSGLVCARSRSNDSHRSQCNPNHWTLKHFRRRCREERLKEQYQTTDDEPMSELKQGRYWTRQQRKEHLIKAKQYRQRAKYFQQSSLTPYSDSATEDFNLLNRIFLQENKQELKQKPFLAYKYGQQSSIERNRLKQMIQQQQHYFNRRNSQSNTTISISSTFDKPLMIIL